MNILYHHRTQGKGGEGVHIREITNALKDLGHTVIVVSPPAIDIFAEITAQSQNPKKTGLANMWDWISRNLPQLVFELVEICYNISAYYKLKQALKKNRIDFIYERYAFFCFAGTLLAKKYAIPLILEVNEISGIRGQRGQVLISLANKIEQMVFRQAASIVTISSFLKSEICNRGLKMEKIKLIPNAINAKKFNPEIDGSQIRNYFKLNGKIVMLFAGHFSKWDRFSFLIENFIAIEKQYQNIHLLLIGYGKEYLALENLIRRKGLQDRIALTGKIDRKDMPCYIAASDICLIPSSNTFGSPLVLFEYMAMKKSVVAPKLGPIKDIIQSGINGLLFSPDDSVDFRQTLIQLINNKNLREAIGLSAYQTVTTKHLWENNAREILRIYQASK
ncbi:MAG: glycosyltransferase family 4 protein [Actinomycetota bacterium]